MIVQRRPAAVGAFLALLIAITASGLPAHASAATPSAIPLFAAPFSRDVRGGDLQKIYIHSIALATVRLKVDDGDGQSLILQDKTNAAGIHQFEWKPSYSGLTVVLAHYWVYIDRDSIHTSARGTFVLYPALPPTMQVDVLTPIVETGKTFQARVQTRPGAAVSLSVLPRSGKDALLVRSTVANASGAWEVDAPLSPTVAITDNEALNVVVTSQFLGHQTVVNKTLVLRPLPGIAPGVALPAQTSLSLRSARARADAAAGGSFTLAQGNARLAVQRLTTDAQVLTQFATVGMVHSLSYDRGLVTSASTYKAYINATAQVLSDDATIAARMKTALPYKVVMVSLDEQYLREYQGGVLVHSNDITTGRPALPTITGHFAIYEKVTPFEFHSPWPLGSPYYYAPTWIKYWMPFTGGYGLHDAWWRGNYGPGTNLSGDGPGSSEPTGTHGCVNLPFADTVWLWNWAAVGTPVVVYTASGASVTSGGPAGI